MSISAATCAIGRVWQQWTSWRRPRPTARRGDTRQVGRFMSALSSKRVHWRRGRAQAWMHPHAELRSRRNRAFYLRGPPKGVATALLLPWKGPEERDVMP
ncbi:hypothetical protein Arub01_16380 [Actinomadura rubrobrunea]|uniref:Uncharacterized protein n=1 Tax=Actinomadura rubrobrunea TaxID=115335 RepID=A0A9W6UU21_9ACTN|nr:hypothetical protein Arub01_16380 [Actinomadura rubrobrunea]